MSRVTTALAPQQYRFSVAASLLLLLGACGPFGARGLQAQVSIAARVGVHRVSTARPDRFLIQQPSGYRMESAQGEAPALSIELGMWSAPSRGWLVEVLASRNRSWRGRTVVPPPAFSTVTVFVNGRMALRTRPDRALGAELVVGPSVVFHAGTGESELSRPADPGMNLGVRGWLRLLRHVVLNIAVQDMIFLSTYWRAWDTTYHGGGLPDTVPAGTALRSEPAVLIGFSWSGVPESRLTVR